MISAYSNSLVVSALVLPRFTEKKSYVCKAINRERGNSCLPNEKEEFLFLFLFFIFIIFIFIIFIFIIFIFIIFIFIIFIFIIFIFIIFIFFHISFFANPPSHLLLLPADRQPLRSRVGFYHLVAGLLNPTALLMRAKFFNLPVPIGQDFFNSPALHDGSFNNN